MPLCGCSNTQYNMYASAGIRNVVGMQFHPVTNTLYFSNNGRDQIGDNVPDDYIAYAPVEGLDFGYPHCHRYGPDVPSVYYGILAHSMCTCGPHSWLVVRMTRSYASQHHDWAAFVSSLLCHVPSGCPAAAVLSAIHMACQLNAPASGSICSCTARINMLCLHAMHFCLVGCMSAY